MEIIEAVIYYFNCGKCHFFMSFITGSVVTCYLCIRYSLRHTFSFWKNLLWLQSHICKVSGDAGSTAIANAVLRYLTNQEKNKRSAPADKLIFIIRKGRASSGNKVFNEFTMKCFILSK